MKEAKSSQRLALSLDLRLVCLILLLTIVAMLVMWRPWQAATAGDDGKITVRGEATVKAEPDQYQFSPMYERDSVEEVAKLSTELTAKLKELGVADKDIKTNASAYDKYDERQISPTPPRPTGTTNTLSLTITVNNKDLAQKVQDYLVSTAPQGSITPYPTFSEAKRKSLEEEARNKAIEDARKRADQTAQNLKAKVGSVKEVKEGTNFGIMPYAARDAIAAPEAGATTSSLPIQAGENEYSYSVEVTFTLK